MPCPRDAVDDLTAWRQTGATRRQMRQGMRRWATSELTIIAAWLRGAQDDPTYTTEARTAMTVILGLCEDELARRGERPSGPRAMTRVTVRALGEEVA